MARGDRPLLQGLDLELGAGDVLLVQGPNGSGKSSLLRCLAGLLRPAAGRVRLGGGALPAEAAEPAVQRADIDRADVHLVQGPAALKPDLTALENLAFLRALLGGTGDLAHALERVGLTAAAALPARFLSTGQRRRATLARLLVAARPVWLLDEPEAGLDAEGRQRLAAMVGAQAAGGGIVVLATHALDLVPVTLRLDLGGRPAPSP